MLKAASEAFFYTFGSGSAHLLEDFKEIMRHAPLYSERRNEITHAAVEHYRREPRASETRAYALFPAFATVKDRSTEDIPTYCYTAAELEYFRKQFFVIAKPARTLASKVSSVKQLAASRGKSRWRYRSSTNQRTMKNRK